MVHSQMADLRAEVGVLARTADILQNQYNEVKQTIVSRSLFCSLLGSFSKFEFLETILSFILLTYPETYFSHAARKFNAEIVGFLGQTRGNQYMDSILEDYQRAHACSYYSF